MIGRIYRLMDTKRIEMKQREITITDNMVLVRPEYMTICAADQRYYLGQRKKEILAQKLPMALIHEATGTVIKDFSGKYQYGNKVVLIPLDDGGTSESEIKGNYRTNSKFASSGVDGFMRDIVSIPGNQLILIDDNYSIKFVFTELLSVAIGAINTFEFVRQTSADSIGIWGDGSVGFITALAVRCKYPKSKVYVFGKSVRKLSKFSFVTKKYYIDDIPDGLIVNHAFECVGDKKSEAAISQIIDKLTPQGVVSLLGVSENSVAIDTRKILDKGLKLVGNSRSDKFDFEEAVQLIRENEVCQKYIGLLISEILEIKNDNDILRALEQDILNDFKTVIKWSL